MKTLSLSFNVRHLLMSVVLLLATTVHAQYGIGTNSPNAQAALHIESANHGLLIPNVTLTNADTFLGGVTATSDHNSMLVYNTSTSTANNLTGAGFYYWTGGATGSWVRLQTGSAGTISTATLAPGSDGQVLTTTGTSVGWQTPTAATMSHWLDQTTMAPATLNTQDIVQNGNVAVGTATNRKSLSFSGGLFGNVRIYSGSTTITYTEDDFAVVFTDAGLVNSLTLPDATTNNTGRIIGLYNQSTSVCYFISRSTPPAGMSEADVEKVTPVGFTKIYAKSGALFISDGLTWYPIGAR